MNESITIILPLPPKVLSPNWGFGGIGARMAKAAAAKKQKNEVADFLIGSGIREWKKVKVIPTFFHKIKRRRDSDNAIAMLKSAYDGIIEASLVPDDTSEYMERMMPVFLINKDNPRVELRLERLA